MLHTNQINMEYHIKCTSFICGVKTSKQEPTFLKVANKVSSIFLLWLWTIIFFLEKMVGQCTHKFAQKNLQNIVKQPTQCPKEPYISMHILHNVLYTFF